MHHSALQQHQHIGKYRGRKDLSLLFKNQQTMATKTHRPPSLNQYLKKLEKKCKREAAADAIIINSLVRLSIDWRHDSINSQSRRPRGSFFSFSTFFFCPGLDELDGKFQTGRHYIFFAFPYGSIQAALDQSCTPLKGQFPPLFPQHFLVWQERMKKTSARLYNMAEMEDLKKWTAISIDIHRIFCQDV